MNDALGNGVLCVDGVLGNTFFFVNDILGNGMLCVNDVLGNVF